MASKIFAGFIVAFWLVMMAALMRVEVFPRQISADVVPPERVMRSIVLNPDAQNLNVFYHNRQIGSCKLEIQLDQAVAGNYKVLSDLDLALNVLGTTSKMFLTGNSTFDAMHKLKGFNLRIKTADGEVKLFGDELSGKATVVIDFGDKQQTREFAFNELSGAGFANAFGLPGLASLEFFGGALTGQRMNGVTRTSYDWLRFGDIRQRTYLIDSRLDENLWAKLWVSEIGELLKVETSLDLTMKVNGLGDSR